MKKAEDLPVRRTYRFRVAGLIYLTVTGFLSVAAISSQNNLLFWCLGVAVAGIAVSGLISGVGLMGVRAERLHVPDASAGGTMVVRYRVRNVNRFAPAFGLTIYERSKARRRRATHPWRLRISTPVAYVACVGPGQSVIAEGEPSAFKRGRVQFTEFVVVSAFPFGLANKALRFVQRREALVLPREAPVRPEIVRPASSIGDRVGSVSSRGGEIGDVFGVREYIPGDPPRSIAWRASARHGDLVVRQHVSPTPRRLWVRLELAADEPEDEREAAISLAAGVLRAGANLGYGVGVVLPSPGAGESVSAAGLPGSLTLLASLGEPELLPGAGATAPTFGRRDSVITVGARAGGRRSGQGVFLAADSPAGWSAVLPLGAGGGLRS